MVRNKGESTFLLKQIQPVVADSGKSAGRLTEKSLPRTIRLQERAGEIEEHIREAGGQMAVNDLERQIRKGLRRNNITVRGFLKLYPERFAMRGGVVTVKDAVAPAAPAPTPVAPAAPAPIPGSAEFLKLSMEEQIKIVDARRDARQAARRQTNASRLRAMPAVYG